MERTIERGVADMLEMELACRAGSMEERGEISIPSWDELSSAIADSIYEYYENNVTATKDCVEIAVRIFMTRFKKSECGIPDGYAEIEYRDFENAEAIEGAKFDDLNYLRYTER